MVEVSDVLLLHLYFRDVEVLFLPTLLLCLRNLEVQFQLSLSAFFQVEFSVKLLASLWICLGLVTGEVGVGRVIHFQSLLELGLCQVNDGSVFSADNGLSDRLRRL